MKLIRAVVRPEKEDEVVASLEKAGFAAVTKLDVLGRGRQKGIQVGTATYDELAKAMVLIAVEDEKCDIAIEAISSAAKTGNFGDGKIFVTSLEQVYTIRTGRQGI
jgi:nitrogen regulatory protein PII 1